jgi:putative ABC transport system permease protein
LGEAGPNGNATIVEILKVLSIFILIIAYINYINLSSAKAIERAKEIGIRKIVGSSRSQLVIQFLLESFMINISAVILSIGILILLKSYQITPGLDLPFTILNTTAFWIVAGFVLILGSITSGLYPAFVISAYKPVSVLKGKITATYKHSPINLRRGLVTFQFVMAIVMITGSMMIFKQIKFMQNQDLGIDINQTMVLQTFVKFGPPGSDSTFLSKLEVFKHELEVNKNIKGATATYDIPGKEHLSLFSNFFRSIKSNEEIPSLYYSRIDYDFLPLYKARLVAGRNFSPDWSTDNQAIIVNMEALKALGFEKPEDAVDQNIILGREPNLRAANIIGVVDFRSTSFKNENYPVVYQINWAPMKYLSIKLDHMDGETLSATINFVKARWERIFPEQPFSYFFLDDFFNRQYAEEQKFSTTLTAFTGLAVFIACLGLYGLSSIITTQRTKEIGIRKVLGASVKNLFLLFSKDFGVLIFMAGCISAPLVWYSGSLWLENYPYHTEMTWWIFLLPLAIMAILVFITIAQHALRAVLVNPVESLRYE